MLVVLIQTAFRNRIFGSKSNKPALNYVSHAQWWVTAQTQAWLFVDIGENDQINPQPVTVSGNTSPQSLLFPEKHPQQICPVKNGGITDWSSLWTSSFILPRKFYFWTPLMPGGITQWPTALIEFKVTSLDVV